MTENTLDLIDERLRQGAPTKKLHQLFNGMFHLTSRSENVQAGVVCAKGR
jgi:hypothetical protein